MLQSVMIKLVIGMDYCMQQVRTFKSHMDFGILGEFHHFNTNDFIIAGHVVQILRTVLLGKCHVNQPQY